MSTGTLMQAVLAAQKAHGAQVRKDGKPVMTHLMGTAALLVAHGETDEELLCAAVLHDVYEDCENVNFTPFSTRTFDLVMQVTKRDGLANHFDITSKDGFNLKMADRLNNLQEMHSLDKSFRARQVLKTFELLLVHAHKFPEKNIPLFNALLKELRKNYHLVTL